MRFTNKIGLFSEWVIYLRNEGSNRGCSKRTFRIQQSNNCLWLIKIKGSPMSCRRSEMCNECLNSSQKFLRLAQPLFFPTGWVVWKHIKGSSNTFCKNNSNVFSCFLIYFAQIKFGWKLFCSQEKNLLRTTTLLWNRLKLRESYLFAFWTVGIKSGKILDNIIKNKFV